MMMNSFVNDTPWDHIVNTLDRYSKITKQDVINFAKETFNNNNYCIVYKRVGEDKSVQKVTKPTITPVQINRNDQSEFVKSTLSNTPTTIEPKFINYEQDIIKSNLKNNVTLLYNQNTENELFSLRYVFEMGSNHNKMLPIAVEYVPYLGTTSLTLAQIQQEFYKIGCEYNVYASEDQVWVSLSGLNENLDKASQLFENLFKNPQVEPITLKNLTEDIIKKREDAKKEKSNILQDKMVEYAKYGPKNASTNILTNIELAALSTDQIKNCLINLMTYNHKVLYYGPSSKEGVEKLINNNHIADFTGTKPVPMAANYELQKFNNIIYFVPYDMKQTEVVMLSSGDKFDLTQKPIINLYNAYFGGDMSSVVFQELRESKALAYSCYSQYSPPYKPDNSYYNFSYIGAQADKLSDAIEGMSKLLNDLPKSDLSFTNAKKSILQRISTERITKMDMLFNYLKAEKFNLKHDIRQTVFEKVPALKFEDVKNFQSAKIKNKPFALLLIGNKSLIDFKALQKYGTVKELTLKEIFGY